MNHRSRRPTLFVLVAGLAMFATACGASSVVVTESTRVEPPPTPSVSGSEPAAEDSHADDGFNLAPVEADPAQEPTVTVEAPESEDPVQADTAVPNEFSAALLRQAATTTDTLDSYRFEVFVSMLIDDGSFRMDFSPDLPLSTGHVSGASQRTLVDLGPLFDEMLSAIGDQGDLDVVEQMFGGDLTMEVIVDNTTMYLRAPFLAGMANGPAGAELPSSFGQLGDGWGVVDLSAIPGFDAADVAGLAGAQSGSSPDQMLAMLEAAGSEVADLGRETVRGVDTTHLRAVVNILAMMEAQGLSAADLGVADTTALRVDLPFDVYVDDDARVRRVGMSLSLDELQALAPEQALPPGTNFEFSTTIDLFDFGADISIDPPAQSDIVGDFTDLFAELAQRGS